MADTGAPGFIPLASGSDPFSPPQAPLNALATALNTALQKTAFNTYGTKAALDLVPGTAVGQHASVNADTAALNGDYAWGGSAWIQIARSGLVPVVPASVSGSGVSVGANGVVSFTAATAVSLNGVFTTRFDNYKVLVDIPASSATAGGQFRLRASGSDDTSGNYSYQQSWSSGSALTANNAGGVAFWGAFPVAGVESSLAVDLFDPALAKATRIQIRGSMWSSSTAGVDHSMSGRHAVTNSYDGLTYTPSTGNVTGTLRVYGYNNN